MDQGNNRPETHEVNSVLSLHPLPLQPQRHFPLTWKPLVLAHKYVGQRNYRSGGNVLSDLSMTLTGGHSCGTNQIILCLHDRAMAIHPITTTLDSYIPKICLWPDQTPKNFRQCYFVLFLFVFIVGNHYIDHILGMVGLTETKRKGNASIGCWAKYDTMVVDLTHDID